LPDKSALNEAEKFLKKRDGALAGCIFGKAQEAVNGPSAPFLKHNTPERAGA
jgi:hypothetical protein